MYYQSVMKYIHLMVEEREKIQEMLWQKASIRSIATTLGRSPSSISREINRNRDSIGRRFYIPRGAHERALKKRKLRGREDRLKNNIIRDYVIKHLKKGWSPEQIAGRLSEEAPGQKISYETIYQYIYEGEGRFEYLYPHLRRGRAKRQKQRARKPHKTSIPERISI